MAKKPKLNKPWMVAVWPGMGHVAISAGYYLMAKLGMHVLAEFSSRELFDIDHVEVKAGLIKNGRLPRSRLFVWNDPNEKRDLVVFIGEAQPPTGRYLFSRQLTDYAKQLGVERIYTFAAMATQMHPEHAPRVFAATTSEDLLAELRQEEVVVLESGQISGLNGVLLGVASELDLQGVCLLGEMPHLFAQLPFPAASLSVLKAFSRIAQIPIDLGELGQQAQDMGKRLGEILAEVEQRIKEHSEIEGETEFKPPTEEEPRVKPAEEKRVEQLFEQAREDRSKAYELKN